VNAGPRIFVVAGEASGDSHGAALVRALRELEPTVRCESLGGPLLAEAGAPSSMDFVAHATMGLFPVLKKLPFFTRVLRETSERLAADPPDVLVPIDYPGFNLRLARKAKASGIPVCYYVSPQVWAWAPWRVKKIARSVDQMMCLFPFEKRFYEERGVPVTHVGHPIFDSLRAEKKIAGFRDEVGAGPTDPIVALLPGSREQEVATSLPVMLEAGKALLARASDARFLVPCANPKLREAIDALVAASGLPVTVLEGQAREIARRARLALVTSGTATLELLYHEVPMVVLYRAGQLQVDFVRRFLLHVKWASLVNILADRDVVPEFLGDAWTSDQVAETAIELLRDGRARKKMLARLHDLRREVDMVGASQRAARVVLALAKASKT
jgi:lipid-A-disaccharide synthase